LKVFVFIYILNKKVLPKFPWEITWREC